jgi:hypothetical protein
MTRRSENLQPTAGEIEHQENYVLFRTRLRLSSAVDATSLSGPRDTPNSSNADLLKPGKTIASPEYRDATMVGNRSAPRAWDSAAGGPEKACAIAAPKRVRLQIGTASGFLSE